MRFFRDLPIKWKLTLIILVTSATPLLLSCAAFVFYEFITMRQWMVRELQVQANIIGSNNLGNLTFHSVGLDTREDAAATLKSLQVNEHIIAAGILAQDETVLATYGTPQDLPPLPSEDAHFFERDKLLFFKSIVQDGERIGTIFIQSDLSPLYSRLQQYIGIVVLFVFGSFIVAFVLSAILQRLISKPILHLSGIATQVSEKEDFSMRAKKLHGDEVGDLIDAFNGMLSHIEQRDEELTSLARTLRELQEQLDDYSHNIEKRVDKRTQELQDKNKKLDEALQKVRETQNQIILQEKMASLGALTAGIAHEIKNPLNFVNNFAELSIELTQELRDELLHAHEDGSLGNMIENMQALVDDLERNAKKINEHGKRADSIVRSMLQHSRGRAGNYEMTDINALLAQALNLTYHGMRSQYLSFNIIMETSYDDTIGDVSVIPQDISRVFLNLINNGCFAAYQKQKSGEAPAHFMPKITVQSKNLNNQIEIRIRDNGTGIPDSLREKIFTPFFSTKPPGQGTGLGLSISYDIVVKGHEGALEIDTKEGEFTEFIVRLPKSKDDPANQ